VQQHGVTLLSNEQSVTVRPRCTADPTEAGEQDYVFVTLKAHSLPAAAPQIASLLGPRSALVTGIIGVVLSWYWPAGLVLGVVAVVCGVVGRKSAARGEATNAGTATAGLVLGIIGLVLTAVFAAFIISAAM